MMLKDYNFIIFVKQYFKNVSSVFLQETKCKGTRSRKIGEGGNFYQERNAKEKKDGLCKNYLDKKGKERKKNICCADPT